ncbi:glutamate--cysteine ligase [Streptomyces sp. NPDC015220]|uniref:carboxylate-amine ligase n=1 Tax=Streptomyces sp. NPDC015220 TaxID=3364947 RepID=UPI0036F696AA
MDGGEQVRLRDRTTLGVEEEFLLLDRSSGLPVGRSGTVVETGRARLGDGRLVHEISQAMVETVSGVCGTARDLRRELLRLRGGVARAAGVHDCLLLASGTSPLGHAGPALDGDPAGTPGLHGHPRYARIRQRFGPLLQDQGVCGCHVHVGVPDLATAVAVVDRLRPWLPLLLALTANSPFWHGRDTGYASWRTMLWGRWPTAGPPPLLRSAEHYEEIVGTSVASGAVLDPGMIYWFARPSRHVPTVEVRVADVLPTVAETVAYALLVRALVARARSEVDAGAKPPETEHDVLVAACWQAAREGVTGNLLDLTAGSPPAVTPVVRQIETLRRLAWPHMAQEGDRAVVGAWLDRLSAEGGAADRQRETYARTGRLEKLVDTLALAVPDTSPVGERGIVPSAPLLSDPGESA